MSSVYLGRLHQHELVGVSVCRLYNIDADITLLLHTRYCTGCDHCLECCNMEKPIQRVVILVLVLSSGRLNPLVLDS